MPSLSSGINIALQAILAHSQTMEIIEHNVANANTRGYHRQMAVLASTTSNPIMLNNLGYGAGQLGTGVTVERIQRFSLDFFDERYRSVSAGAKSWEYQSEILSQMEITLSDLSDDGIPQKLDEYWNAWQNLASDPTNSTLRSEVIYSASSLAEKFNRNAQQLIALRRDQNLTLNNRVDEINSLSSSIASLNAQISNVLSVGQQPNDLLDKRDLALDRLAELTGAVSFTQENGEVVVSISGHVVVTGHDALSLKTEPDPNPANAGVDRIIWEKDSAVFKPYGGELEGILEVRDAIIPDYLSKLDTVASKIILEVNSLHNSGFGLDGSSAGVFFSGSGALDIKVRTDLKPENLGVTSITGEIGNSEIATQIYKLRDRKFLASDTQSIGEYYNAQMSSLASVAKQAEENSQQHSVVQEALDSQRESLSGVLLDEEAANLAKAQKAYQAAARVMTAYDELLNMIINEMGLVGR